MSKQLCVGIAGYGVVGKRRREFIDLNPNMQTVAVCDRTFNNSGHLADGLQYYQTYNELLSEQLDVLFVCLTNDVAAEVSIAGLERGLHVFCEKPPGRNLADINSVRTAESQCSGLKLMYGFNHRHHDSVRDALELVHGGTLGTVISLRGVYGKSKIISYESDWRTKREISGGGILLDQGIHMVDLMRLFAGEFEDVHSFISNDYWGHDVEDNAYALMRTKQGIVAFLHSTATQWRHRFHLDITLSKGAISLSGILSGSKSYGAETITVCWKGADDMGDPKEQMTRYNQDNSWLSEITEFADAIVNDKQIQSGSSEDALKTMQLVYKIYCADPEWRQRYNLTDT